MRATREHRPDGIGKAALLAHFSPETRGKAAAAEDMVQHTRRHVHRVLAGDAGQGEVERRLRDINVDDLARTEPLRDHIAHEDQRRRCRQTAKGRLDGPCQFVRRNRANGDDPEVGAREELGMLRDDLGAGDLGEFRDAPIRRQAIRVPGIGARGQCVAGAGRRIRFVALEAGDDLRADALDCILIEARRLQRQPQQFEGRRDILGQRAERTVEAVATGIEREFDRLFLELLLKILRGERAGALIHQPRKEIGEACTPCGVLRCATEKGELHGDHRHGVILDVPDLDPRGSTDRFDAGRTGSLHAHDRWSSWLSLERESAAGRRKSWVRRRTSGDVREPSGPAAGISLRQP